MAVETTPRTQLCSHDEKAIYVRGRSLVDELIGGMSFTEMTHLI